MYETPMHVYVVCVWWNLHHTDSFEAQIWRVSDGKRAANHMRAPVHFWGQEERAPRPASVALTQVSMTTRGPALLQMVSLHYKTKT